MARWSKKIPKMPPSSLITTSFLRSLIGTTFISLVDYFSGFCNEFPWNVLEHLTGSRVVVVSRLQFVFVSQCSLWTLLFFKNIRVLSKLTHNQSQFSLSVRSESTVNEWFIAPPALTEGVKKEVKTKDDFFVLAAHVSSSHPLLTVCEPLATLHIF